MQGSSNRHQPKKLAQDAVGAGAVGKGGPLWPPVAGVRAILLDYRRPSGYTGGHKGPHTTPHHPRPYGHDDRVFRAVSFLSLMPAGHPGRHTAHGGISYLGAYGYPQVRPYPAKYRVGATASRLNTSGPTIKSGYLPPFYPPTKNDGPGFVGGSCILSV